MDESRDDLSNRDLSQVADEELTAEERAELRRRLDEFVEAMREQVLDDSIPSAKPKRVTAWRPA
jgi:anti-sigma factor RsiW